MLLINRCYHQGIITWGTAFGKPRAAVLKLGVALDNGHLHSFLKAKPPPSRASLTRTEKFSPPGLDKN